MMKIKRRIRKRSFLLFEILVCLALVSMCLFPLLLPQTKIKKDEKKYLETLFFENASHSVFCHLKERLYEQDIKWQQLMDRTIISVYTMAVSFLDKTYHPLIELTPMEVKKRNSTKEQLAALRAEIYFESGNKKVGPFPFFFNVEKKNS